MGPWRCGTSGSTGRADRFLDGVRFESPRHPQSGRSAFPRKRRMVGAVSPGGTEGAAEALLFGALTQLEIHGNAHLPRIAPLQKGLHGIVRGDQPEIKSLLGVAGIEEIAHP